MLERVATGKGLNYAEVRRALVFVARGVCASMAAPRKAGRPLISLWPALQWFEGLKHKNQVHVEVY